MSRLAASFLLAVALAACGGGEQGADGDDPRAAAPEVELHVVSRPKGPRGEALDVTLTCDPAGGSHPDPEAACQALAANRDALAEVDSQTVCTQEYGGPARARVSGTIREERVEAELTRSNGCEIARWEALAPLVDPSGLAQ